MYLYSHDIYKESMHNKRFIILYRLFVFVCMAVLIFLRFNKVEIIVSKMIYIGGPPQCVARWGHKVILLPVGLLFCLCFVQTLFQDRSILIFGFDFYINHHRNKCTNLTQTIIKNNIEGWIDSIWAGFIFEKHLSSRHLSFKWS